MQINVDKLREALPGASVAIKKDHVHFHMNSINREEIFALERALRGKNDHQYVIKRSGTGLTIIISAE